MKPDAQKVAILMRLREATKAAVENLPRLLETIERSSVGRPDQWARSDADTAI